MPILKSKRRTRKTIRGIIQKAKELYKRYGSEEIDSVVKKLGAELYEDHATRNINEVYYLDLKAIAIKPNLHPYERKYLIAHTLDHHLFYRGGLFQDYIRLHEEGIFGSREFGRIERASKEREADLFAAYFLIPDEKFKPILEEEWFKESSNPIPKLTDKFQVPEELVRMRLEFEKFGGR
jgi:Zn-dependent peptidase ImmA (M78 family)